MTGDQRVYRGTSTRTGGQVAVTRRALGGPSVARQSTSFLYSANKLPTALVVGDYDFFVVGVGQIGQGYATALTKTETNLQTARRIPDQERWQIREMGFYMASATVLADARKILDNGYLWLDKPDFTFTFGSPAFYPGGAGLSGFSSDTTGLPTVVTNGWPTATARVKLKTPILLDPGETFAFHYSCTLAQTLSAATSVWIELYGETVKEIVQ